jgi:hypothetical protein
MDLKKRVLALNSTQDAEKISQLLRTKLASKLIYGQSESNLFAANLDYLTASLGLLSISINPVSGPGNEEEDKDKKEIDGGALIKKMIESSNPGAPYYQM